jgi:hypothetical protein
MMHERMGSRMVAMAGAALLCAGCAHRPCAPTNAASIALDVACAATGLETQDARLLLVCADAFARVQDALKTGTCAVELSDGR